MAERRVRTMGDRAVLVELPDLEQALALFDALAGARLAGVVESVPAARTVLVRFDPLVTSRREVVAAIDGLALLPGIPTAGRLVEVGVHYDGDDLTAVAELLGVDERQVVHWHTTGQYRVAFGGFAPGFAYLTGGDPRLDVPRRASPRTRIPSGAVALAGAFSAVYPRESPGGWQVIGRTDLPMWNLDRNPPATLQPGDRVRFVDLGQRDDKDDEGGRSGERAQSPAVSLWKPVPDARTGARTPVPATAAQGGAGSTGPALAIVRCAVPVLVQDEGRPGQATLGVPGSGALDRRSLHAANRLVGNAPDEAALEVSLAATVRAVGTVVVAVTGERVSVVVLSGRAGTTTVNDCRPVLLRDGDTLMLEVTSGARAYLGVRGGLDVPPVLGSRSHDVLSGIGPAPLRAGVEVPLRRSASAALDAAGDPEPWPSRLASVVELPVLLGPRDDRFDADATAALFDQVWTVTPQSNRVGLRLAGRPLVRTDTDELPSEGMVAGAIQVPADGQPVLFLADHPVTGGYPVIAVLQSSALDVAGQLGSGARVRFHPA